MDKMELIQDKTELIQDISTIEEMIEQQLQLIEELQNEVKKGQLILKKLKSLEHESHEEEEIIEMEFGDGLFG